MKDSGVEADQLARDAAQIDHLRACDGREVIDGKDTVFASSVSGR